MRTLSQVISLIESSNNQFAIRFESVSFNNPPPWITAQVAKIAAANECNETTALQIACTSYGYYQILGANIYALGWVENIFMWVNVDYKQYNTFTRFISPKGFLPSETMEGWDQARYNSFATFYNGPGNVDVYAARMKDNS